jgi:Uma2 family endonuclease
MSDTLLAPLSDQSLYSLHPEEDVVETDPHRHQVVYLETNLRALLRDRYVGADIGVYWIPGAFEEPWVGPDVLVSQPTARREPRRVYLLWEHGPIAFVAEVASERTRAKEAEKRETRYRVDLAVPEYLYIDLDRRELQMWRLRDGTYEPVSAVDERLRSKELGVSFGWDPEQAFVRIWTPEGEMLLTKEEDLRALEEIRARAREAEAARREAEAARREAEAARREAQRRARAEAAERRAAEARIAELEAEIERLRPRDRGE